MPPLFFLSASGSKELCCNVASDRCPSGRRVSVNSGRPRMKSATVSTMKQILRASLSREPLAGALVMAWRSYMVRGRHFLALARAGKPSQSPVKTTRKFAHFRVKNVSFLRFSARADPIHGLRVFCGVFHSILDMWGSSIGLKITLNPKNCALCLISFLLFCLTQ